MRNSEGTPGPFAPKSGFDKDPADQGVPTPRPLSAEPLTEAGRILLREHSSGTPHMARHILAIEAEAADAARAAITPEADEVDVRRMLLHRAHNHESRRVPPPRSVQDACPACVANRAVQLLDDHDSRFLPALLAALRVTPVEGEAGLRAAMDRALIAFYETHIALVYKSENGRREYLTGQRAHDGRESWRRQVEAAVRAALSPEEPRS